MNKSQDRQEREGEKKKERSKIEIVRECKSEKKNYL